MKNEFPKRFKELREEKGLTQIAAGKLFGYSQATVAKWENGTIEPPYDTLLKICLEFKSTTDYILGFE